MEPVRVKVYGLVWMKKRTYVTLQTIGLVVLLILLAAGLFWPRLERTPQNAPINLLLDALPWLAVITLAVEGVETFLVLRKFTQKEAEQRLETPGPDPTQPP